MKNLIRKLILVVLPGLLDLLIYGIFIRKAKAEKAADRIKTLPDLVLTDIRGDTVKTSQIHTGPVLITFFHPECDHCKYEISSILGSTLIGSQVTVLLVSYANKSEIISFMRQFDIEGSSTLHILHDPDHIQWSIYSELTPCRQTSFIMTIFSLLRFIKALPGLKH